MSFKMIAALSAVALLVACGGGSGGGLGSGGGGGRAASFNALVADQDAVLQRYFGDNSIDDDITPAAGMPRSGLARYVGTGSVLVASGSRRDIVAGRADLVADFDSSSVSGSVSSFRAAPGTRSSGGNIDVSGAVTGSAITGSMSGNIDINGRTHSIDSRAEGAFLGPRANDLAIAGSGRTDRGSDYMVLITGER